MQKQVNRHRKAVKYSVDNFVKVWSENNKTIRSLKKLNDRMFNLFKIVKRVSAFYRLRLFLSMHQHDVFLFNYLKSVVNNSLSN